MKTENSARPVDVADADFEQAVLRSEVPVLVDFWAEWCGPCRVVGPTVSQIAAEYGDRLIVAKVDVDENPDSAARFGIRSIPTLKLFKSGEVVETAVGVTPKSDLAALIDPHL